MPTNDFIGFASAGSANIMSQADYAAAAEQTDGVQPGPASSALANKVWRQGANMAAAIGQLITGQGQDALDDGDIATLAQHAGAALFGSVTSDLISQPRTFKAKLPSGMMIQGVFSVSFTTDANSRVQIIYDEAFIESPFIAISKYNQSQSFNIYSSTASSITMRCNDMSGNMLGSGISVGFMVIAIGRWA